MPTSENPPHETKNPAEAGSHIISLHFEQFLAANPQQDPQLVANAVADVIETEAGRRAFRTEVDRIGMADAIRPVNELHAEITRGLFSNLGMGDLLALRTGPQGHWC